MENNNIYRITTFDLFDLIQYNWDKMTRYDLMEKAIDVWYDGLNGHCRDHIYNLSVKFLTIENAVHERFFARYNPDNQFNVKLVDGTVHQMYLLNGKYYKNRGWYADANSIVSVKPIAVNQ